MKLFWTQEAVNNLIEIEDFIAQDNPKLAEEFNDYFVEIINLILNNP